MIVDRRREKLENAILFFIAATDKLHTVKLLKLLNFLDFEHYRQTGNSVTGLEYYAWRMGPVAKTLHAEIKSGKIGNKIEVTFQGREQGEPVAHFWGSDPDMSFFTKREIKILDKLAKEYRTMTGTDMSIESHESDMPWSKVYKDGEGDGLEIPLDLAFESYPLMREIESIEPQELSYRRSI